MRPVPAAVVFVADVVRMTNFYGSLCAMRVLHDAADFAVLECDGMQLTLHALRGASEGDATRHDSYLKLCLPVVSIADARVRAPALGGELWPSDQEWEAPERGFRACDGRDPEGNVFQVREAL